MNFLKLMFKSGLGAAAGLAIYMAATLLLIYGALPLAVIVVNSLVLGTIFGGLFALVHLKKSPTFGSSALTGIGFSAGMMALSIFAGTFAGFSIPAVIGLVIFGLIVGGGAFVGTRVGK